MNRVLSYMLPILLGQLLFSQSVLAYQEEVDWMWQDVKAKARGGAQCKNFVVKAGPPEILRGKISGRACLKKAIQSYRHGDHEEAFGWILAGECHDRQARDKLVRHAPKVLEYVVKTYGHDVPDN
ncbi:MAG: hypothetical protein MRJ96_09310 [Nitrospirales bacterium]|nr:hypothetical protein [Nitrospira sp.]MDR4501631.1 hypothetical protein [Nitrospirales bacterium]